MSIAIQILERLGRTSVAMSELPSSLVAGRSATSISSAAEVKGLLWLLGGGLDDVSGPRLAMLGCWSSMV